MSSSLSLLTHTPSLVQVTLGLRSALQAQSSRLGLPASKVEDRGCLVIASSGKLHPGPEMMRELVSTKKIYVDCETGEINLVKVK